ncbi:MAG: hypothetical protein K0R00_4157 [Herbinix sp.]|nr:hypothetical protein [Herbinix sp.]
MDYKVILNLMKEMNQTDLTKLEIEEEGLHIVLEKSAPKQDFDTQVTTYPAFMPGMLPGLMPSAPVQPQIQQPTPTLSINTNVAVNDSIDQVAEELSGKKVVSPMVGTFYTAASPEKPPFVKVGDKVKKGQVLCIIEAMKLMNEIESEYDGEVVKILVNNEEMVEFGKPLFLIHDK